MRQYLVKQYFGVEGERVRASQGLTCSGQKLVGKRGDWGRAAVGEAAGELVCAAAPKAILVNNAMVRAMARKTL